MPQFFPLDASKYRVLWATVTVGNVRVVRLFRTLTSRPVPLLSVAFSFSYGQSLLPNFRINIGSL